MTENGTLNKMALKAAHLNAGVLLVDTSNATYTNSTKRTQTPLNLFQIQGTRPIYVKYKVHKLHQ